MGQEFISLLIILLCYYYINIKKLILSYKVNSQRKRASDFNVKYSIKSIFTFLFTYLLKNSSNNLVVKGC